MKSRSLILLVMSPVLLVCAAQGQYVPVTAKVHEQTDMMIDGKIVATITRDTILRRTANGSTLMTPDGGNAERMLTLWDNTTGIGYRLDPQNHVAHQDPNSPHKPNSPGRPNYEGRFPEDSVEGLKCFVVPAHVMPTAFYSGFSPHPGQDCYSVELDLTLKSDLTIQTAPGKTERHQRTLHDIHPYADPDSSLFDLTKYAVR